MPETKTISDATNWDLNNLLTDTVIPDDSRYFHPLPIDNWMYRSGSTRSVFPMIVTILFVIDSPISCIFEWSIQCEEFSLGDQPGGCAHSLTDVVD